MMGRMTRQAMDNNKKRRESIPLSPKKQKKESNSINQKKSTRFVTSSGANFPSQVIEQAANSHPINLNQDNGHAIYLHYPNFIGNSKNAFKIGGFDPGEALGNPQLPVGHAATILIDNEGNANYYEYGRYSPENGHLIGKEQRPTVKGGNWRHFSLPKQNQGENDSAYVARIQGMLPDTKTGAYQAMSIPSIDVKRAQQYIQQEADNKNRNEYGIFNTCATGACNVILPFRSRKLNNTHNINNREGYSSAALNWSKLPFTTDSYAMRAREAADKVYIMNNTEKSN